MPHLDKLQTLADYLVDLNPKKFDITSWKTVKKWGPIPCGTAACALGWAAIERLFEGLTMEKARWDMIGDGTVAYLPKDGDFVVYGFEAGAKLFDIRFHQSQAFFSVAHYPYDLAEARSLATPQLVAEKIYKFIKAEKAAAHVEEMKQLAAETVEVTKVTAKVLDDPAS